MIKFLRSRSSSTGKSAWSKIRLAKPNATFWDSVTFVIAIIFTKLCCFGKMPWFSTNKYFIDLSWDWSMSINAGWESLSCAGKSLQIRKSISTCLKWPRITETRTKICWMNFKVKRTSREISKIELKDSRSRNLSALETCSIARCSEDATTDGSAALKDWMHWSVLST